MKRILLGTTALFAVGLAAGPAWAADGIKLSVGGFFKEAYMVVLDDDGEGELGNESNTDGFFNDAEIHFTGSTILDNGLEIGARVELEGETDGDQIDEAWVFFSGGFGEIRIGSEDEALESACVVPPGGTANFSAFSPNQWGAGVGSLFAFGGVFGSNSVCSGVDEAGDAQKLLYISPNFAGFQLTASYSPDSAAETHVDGAGPHLGMTAHAEGDSRHNVSVYATYSHEGENWGLTAGIGGSWEGEVEDGDGTSIDNQDFYQAGITLTFGDFSIGVAGEYFNDSSTVETAVSRFDVETWVAGIGAAYQMDAWTFGLQYSHREEEVRTGKLIVVLMEDFDAQRDRVVATVNYALGPGINLDAEIGYTWVDSDPEIEDAVVAAEAGFDDYDAIEIGIGTTITF
jgi:predicted porin